MIFKKIYYKPPSNEETGKLEKKLEKFRTLPDLGVREGVSVCICHADAGSIWSVLSNKFLFADNHQIDLGESVGECDSKYTLILKKLYFYFVNPSAPLQKNPLKK